MAGYSSTPLLKKLGLKSNDLVYVLDAPELYFDWISPLPEGVDVKRTLRGEFNFIHLFVSDVKSMRTWLAKAKGAVVNTGMVWVSWPKKSSEVKTDLDENKIRDYALSIGLVDVKVCAVDETWSGLKFVIPVKSR